jgi:hypothetical protein
LIKWPSAKEDKERISNNEIKKAIKILSKLRLLLEESIKLE